MSRPPLPGPPLPGRPLPGPMPRLAVCSWSLRPTSAQDLVAKMKGTGLNCVQLALCLIRTGAWDKAETFKALETSGLRVVSGMMATEGEDYSTLETIKRTGGVRPDATWEANLSAAEVNSRLAMRLGVRLVTFHAGFLPHGTGDPERKKMIGRLRRLAEVFNQRGVKLAFETGQESAQTLLGVLESLKGLDVGVNFDPANMILYGMGDPVESLKKLAPHVAQIHIKDADPTAAPGTWGTERPVGAGSVNWSAFFGAYRAAGLSCDLVIEREGGDKRTEEINAARRLVESMLGAPKGGGTRR